MPINNDGFFGLPNKEVGGWGLERIQRDLDTMREQIRELKESTEQNNQTVTDQLRDLNAFVFQNVPPVVNYIDNGDFVFEQEDYVPGTNYAGDDTDCAMWYFRVASSTGQVTEHTTTVRSSDGVRTTTSDEIHWSKTTGEIVFGNNGALMSPLPKNLAFPATTLFCRFQIKKSGGGIVIPEGWRLRASIWDNTSGQQKIVEGAVFDISATPAFASPGAFSRNYILRVDTAMDFFYSDVLTPIQVNNQVSVSGIDNVNFVTVSWQVFPEATKYTLYRFDSQFSEWREIAAIVNGATSFRDVGGRTGALFNPPSANILPRAQALFVNFGTYVNTEYQDAIFNIFVPSNYNYALTTNKQWIRIDMVDSNLNFVTMPDDALLIDKMSVGYTNGRFTYSARDLAAQAAVQATTPPPTPPPGGNDGGGGGTTPPPGGGGGGGLDCVKPDTKILIEGNEWEEARNIEVGDYLVNATGTYSKVLSIKHGTTTQFRVITTEKGLELWCSPSHKIIRSFDDAVGTSAFLLKVGDYLVAFDEKSEEMIFDVIQAVEVIEAKNEPVLTFTLEGERTYVANGIVSHNLKQILV